jgi:type II secretory pathway component PulM
VSTGGEDTVHVFEADNETDAEAASAPGPDDRNVDGNDHVVNGPARAPHLSRLQALWVATPSRDRRLIVAGAAALLVAAIAGASALRAHPGVHRSVRTTVIAAPVVSVDAFGCPRGRQCRTRVDPPNVLAAARDALPSARVTYAVQEVDAHTNAVYRTVLRLEASRTSVQVNSQCVPGAAAVTGMPLTVSQVSGTTLTPISIDAPTPPGLKVWAISLPGSRPAASGCGVHVSAESTLDRGIGGRAIDTVVNLLADDARLTVSP